MQESVLLQHPQIKFKLRIKVEGRRVKVTQEPGDGTMFGTDA